MKLQIMKRRHCSPLSVPQEKKRSAGHVAGSPFPVPVATLTGVPASNNYWSVYHGTVSKIDDSQHRVIVKDAAESRTLYRHGYFGELVSDGRVEDKTRLVMEDWTPGLDQEMVKEGEVDKVEQQASSWSEVKAQRCDRNNDNVELHLELCEAFFLSYSLGCLVVHDHRSPLSLVHQWRLFCDLEPVFPARYRVYHHYRSRGWCVRSGVIMGGDWVLYKLGPAHTHSTYVVRVEMVDRRTGDTLTNQRTGAGSSTNQNTEQDSSTNQDQGQDSSTNQNKGPGTTNQNIESDSLTNRKSVTSQLTWSDILGHTRVMGTVKKDLLVVRVSVSWPQVSDSPHCLNTMTLSSLRVRRWVPGDHRWRVKPRVPVLTLD